MCPILRVPSRRLSDAIPGGTAEVWRAPDHTIHDAQANHLETHSDALEAKARAFAQRDTGARALGECTSVSEAARRRPYGTAAAVVQKATEDVARLRRWRRSAGPSSAASTARGCRGRY